MTRENIQCTAQVRKITNLTSFIFKWLNQIQDDPATSAPELQLAFVLSQMFNKGTRSCYPLQSTLAQRMRVSSRSVREYVAGLVERGHLVVQDRGRDKSSTYAAALQDRKLSSGHVDERTEASFQSSADHARKFCAARPEVLRRKTGSQLPTEPISEHSLSNAVGGAPSARQPDTARVERKTGCDDGGDGTLSTPPDQLQRATARAREVYRREIRQ
ncbi:MAG TPA: helix-turn-helix domain-containing protein [Afipia sp.]